MIIHAGKLSSHLLLPLGAFWLLLLLLQFTSTDSSSNTLKDFDFNDKEYLSFTSKILSEKALAEKKSSNKKDPKIIKVVPLRRTKTQSSKTSRQGHRISTVSPKNPKPMSRLAPVSFSNKDTWYMKDPGPSVGREARRQPTKPPKDDSNVDDIKSNTGIPGKPTEKPSITSSAPATNSSKMRVRVVNFPDSWPVNPYAPGWFALKANKMYGKELKLGVLLRKKDNGSSLDFSEGVDGDASSRFSYLNRRYDKACRWLEYNDSKNAIPTPTIADPIRDQIAGQNRLLADFFLDLVFDVKPDELSTHDLTKDHAPTTGIELLLTAKHIFHEQICVDREFDEDSAAQKYNPEVDKLLPQAFLDKIVLIFLKLHEITSSTETRDYLDPSEVTWIQSYLTECKQAEPGRSKKILWFPDECNERVVAFDQSNNFACTPYPEFDFNLRKHDPILDTVWHIVTAVQAHCFESFQTNIRMWHRFALAMADLFPPQMRLRWSAASEDNAVFYKRLFGPHYQIYFDNMNRCLYAATLRSNVPYLVPRFEGHRRTQYAPKRYHTLLPLAA